MPKNYSDGDFLSSTVLNNTTIHKMTGAEIFALTSADTIPGYMVYCTESGNGFTIDNLYKMNQDNNAWEVVGLENHTHSSTSGGTLFDVNRVNMGTDYFYNDLAPTAGRFFTAIGTGSGGSVTSTDETVGVGISTGATSGGHATATLVGVRLSFAEASAFQVKLRATSSTNFTQTRIGIGAEHANESNTTIRKYGFEGCSASGVNWLIFSSDNTTRSTLATSTPVTSANFVSYVADNTLAAIEFRVAGSLVASKTSNLPVTSETLPQVFRAGVRNTAAETKNLLIAGVRIAGTISDPHWV